MKKYLIQSFFAILFLCITGVVPAQGSGNVLVVVNGVKITSNQLDQFVALATTQGAQDTPELRQNFLNDLIVREAITQDAKKTGLLTKGNNALKLKIAEQDSVMGLWFTQYLSQHPISEVDVRKEYDKQLALSKDPKNINEYQISQIVVAAEVGAQQILAQLKSGTKFAQLAKEKSLDNGSAKNGGLLGWALPSQLPAPMNELVFTLSKGDISPRPFQIGSAWYVVKVDDVRPFVMPGFDQVKASITQAMMQRERRDAIEALMKGVKVTQGKQLALHTFCYSLNGCSQSLVVIAERSKPMLHCLASVYCEIPNSNPGRALL